MDANNKDFIITEIGKDFTNNIVEEAINGVDTRSDHEKELDRVFVLERKLTLMNNLLVSGTVQGDGITRVVEHTISDKFNRMEIEHKIMGLLKEL